MSGDVTLYTTGNDMSHIQSALQEDLKCVLMGRPFDSWGGGGYGFFVKKKIVQQILENK